MKHFRTACLGLLAAGMLLLAGCGAGGQAGSANKSSQSTSGPAAPHTHAWSDWTVVKAADCTTQGHQVRTCACGVQESEAIPLVSHQPEKIPAVAFTCTQNGLSSGSKCSVCGEILSEQRVLPASHILKTLPTMAATSFRTGATGGSYCSLCKKVLSAPQTLPLVEAEEPPDFNIGYITQKETVIETKYLRFTIPANVYVPDDLAENADYFVELAIQFSGLSFEGKDSRYAGEQIAVRVRRPEGDAETSGSHAHAMIHVSKNSVNMYIELNPADLLTFDTLIHEVVHVLQYRHSLWRYDRWPTEGITTYTVYKVAAYLQEHAPQMLPLFEFTEQELLNMDVGFDYSELYAQSMEHWLSNTISAGNDNYCIGFRFMWYLDTVYGDYIRWIDLYEAQNPYSYQPGYRIILSQEEQVKSFQIAYGADVLDNFYPWLKEHKSLFEPDDEYDLTRVEMVNWLPSFMSSTDYELFTNVSSFLYDDLTLSIEAGKFYLTEYKGKDSNNLTLWIPDATNTFTVQVYDRQGRLLEVYSGNNLTIPLKDVSYIKLVGQGKFQALSKTRSLEITGFQ